MSCGRRQLAHPPLTATAVRQTDHRPSSEPTILLITFRPHRIGALQGQSSPKAPLQRRTRRRRLRTPPQQIKLRLSRPTLRHSSSAHLQVKQAKPLLTQTGMSSPWKFRSRRRL